MLTKYVATIIAKNNKKAEVNANNSRPKLVYDSESLTEISEPIKPPIVPPAIINPYNFLDL